MFRVSECARLSVILLAGVWLAFPLRATPPAVILVSGSDADAHRPAELERETFAFVNLYRQENHLPPLIWNAEIAGVARMHSQAMASSAVDFGHEGFGDRVRVLRQSLAGLRGAGENVLMTDDPGEVARKAVDLWLSSPAHLHNIRGDYNTSGIGVAENGQGVIYFTQIFVKLEAPSAEVKADPPPRITTPFGYFSTTPARTEP